MLSALPDTTPARAISPGCAEAQVPVTNNDPTDVQERSKPIRRSKCAGNIVCIWKVRDHLSMKSPAFIVKVMSPAKSALTYSSANRTRVLLFEINYRRWREYKIDTWVRAEMII